MNALLKWIGIIALVIIGLFVIANIIIPVFGVVLTILWALSGVLAFILKVIFFIALTIAAIAGLILFVSWIIREASE